MKTEKEVRKRFMDHAKKIGAAEDLQFLFDKWDRIIAMYSEKEKPQIAKMAILEIQDLLGIHAETGDGLAINEETIIEAASEDKRWKSWGE